MPSSETFTNIGPFRVVRSLGEGGMGVVYLGERREVFSQRVAIKMLHPEISLVFGDRLLRREDHILTSLDHPGIVRLLDRGEHTTGAHYIVMEYIDGLPLLDYCERNNLRHLQRLALLIEILQAVAYAHRHLIIHGDLKPQNILVTASGHPRLLDFGVAAMLHAQGAADAVALHTPAFASPEQLAGGRLTPACDVYALGRMAEALLGVAPPRSELGTVLQKATRFDPGERYATARDFGDDLQCLLDHRPVSARRGSRAYLLRKWIERHKSATAMAAMVTLAAVGSIGGVVLQTARAAHERTIALGRLHDVAHLTGTLEGDLYRSLPPLPQAEPARQALIRSATESLDNLADQNADDSTLALEMARQYGQLASLALADRAADRAKAFALLGRISTRDPNYSAAQALTVELRGQGTPNALARSR